MTIKSGKSCCCLAESITREAPLHKEQQVSSIAFFCHNHMSLDDHNEMVYVTYSEIYKLKVMVGAQANKKISHS